MPSRGGCASRWWSPTWTTRGGACAPAGRWRRRGRWQPGRWCRARAASGQLIERPKVGRAPRGTGSSRPCPSRAHGRRRAPEPGSAPRERPAPRAPRPRPGSTRGGRRARWGRPARACGRPRRAVHGLSVDELGRAAASTAVGDRTELGDSAGIEAVIELSVRRGGVGDGADLVDDDVGVGEAGEQDLVGAGGEGDAAGRAARGRTRRSSPRRCAGPRRSRSGRRRRGTGRRATRPARPPRRRRRRRTRRAGRPPGARPSPISCRRRRRRAAQGGEAGGGGERVPRERAGLVHGTERGELRPSPRPGRRRRRCGARRR